VEEVSDSQVPQQARHPQRAGLLQTQLGRLKEPHKLETPRRRVDQQRLDALAEGRLVGLVAAVGGSVAPVEALGLTQLTMRVAGVL
jgi:hypothetical protein